MDYDAIRATDAGEFRPRRTLEPSFPFLITGLPRSRTAWLSVASTGPESLCLHEPIAELPSWRDVIDIWGGLSYRYIGISDSAMGFYLGWILENVRPRTLIVERNPRDVKSSLQRVGIDAGQICSALRERLEPHKSHPLVKCVSFDQLRDSAVVVECLNHLMPGASIDLQRIEALQHLNIQTDMARVHRIARERREDAAALFGEEVTAAIAERSH